MHCGLGWWGGAAAANGEIYGILYVYALWRLEPALAAELDCCLKCASS